MTSTRTPGLDRITLTSDAGPVRVVARPRRKRRRKLTRAATADLVKVGPKGYIHGWIHVGAVFPGKIIHHPKHGQGTVSHVDEHGHAHVRFVDANGRTKTRQFQHIDDPSGTGLGRRGVFGVDDMDRHMRAAASASRRRDYVTSAGLYRQAADATSHPKIKADLIARAERDEARAVEAAKPPAHVPGAGRFSPTFAAHVTATREGMPLSHGDWHALTKREARDLSGWEAGEVQAMARAHTAERKFDELEAAAREQLEIEGIPVERHPYHLGNSARFGELAVARTERYTTAQTLARASKGLAEARGRPATPQLPVDPGTGQPMPGEALKQHLEKVLDVGFKALDEIQAEHDADPVLKTLRTDLERQRTAVAAARDAYDRVADVQYGPGLKYTTYAEWRDARNAAFKDRADARRSVEAAERAIRVVESGIIRRMLDGHRGLGGHTHGTVQPLNQDGMRALGQSGYGARPDGLKRLQAAEKLYPTDWLRTSDDAGMLKLGAAKRAYHSERNKVLAMPSKAQDKRVYDGAYRDYTDEVNVHELGHRMETVIPGLREMEFTFQRRAATRGDGVVEKPAKLSELTGSKSYDKNEVAIKDGFADAYVGKTYERPGTDPTVTAWEVFQTGTQDLFGRSTRVLGNIDLQAFTIGALLLLGRRQ